MDSSSLSMNRFIIAERHLAKKKHLVLFCNIFTMIIFYMTRVSANKCNFHVAQKDSEKCLKCIYIYQYSFTVDDIKVSNKHLKRVDQLQAINYTLSILQDASPRLLVLSSLFCNAVVIYTVIPLSLMHTVLIPILKDTKGDVIDENNYRPIQQ